MPISGGLIAESLRVGSVLEAVPLTVRRISRADLGNVDAGQPLTWTFLEFEAPSDDADRLAESLSGALDATGGWYCDFHTDSTTFVVFAGRIFRYPRGDATGRAEAAAHAESVGVPPAQVDWPE